MKMKFNILTFSLLLICVSCNQSLKKNNKEGEQVKEVSVDKDLSKGFQLLESSCFSCHSPNSKLKNKVAPTIATIKKYYKEEGVTKAKFTNSFMEFVKNPIEEKAKVPDAIKHFGLMPKFNFSDEQISQMANYIYNTELENKDWYEKEYDLDKKKYKINNADLSYVELGKKYAMSTKSILGKNLKGAIKNKGTEEAIGFCNEKAYPLTDSMAVVFNANIKRVSDKPRNSLNVANETQLKYINGVKENLEKGLSIKPQIQEVNGKMVGYYPIMTNKMCLQCHGQPETQIQKSTLNKIKLLYPKDMAYGYSENQLRGIWVVEMDKK